MTIKKRNYWKERFNKKDEAYRNMLMKYVALKNQHEQARDYIAALKTALEGLEEKDKEWRMSALENRMKMARTVVKYLDEYNWDGQFCGVLGQVLMQIIPSEEADEQRIFHRDHDGAWHRYTGDAESGDSGASG